MRSWTHGHTLASGFAAGLLADGHALALFISGVVLGVAASYVVRNIRAITRATRSHAARLHDAALARMEAETERKRAAAAEALTRAENRVRKASAQDEAERKAYWRGAVDGAAR